MYIPYTTLTINYAIHYTMLYYTMLFYTTFLICKAPVPPVRSPDEKSVLSRDVSTGAPIWVSLYRTGLLAGRQVQQQRANDHSRLHCVH